MIRKRIPSMDDSAIYKLVVHQLLPFTQLSAPRSQTSLLSVRQRLNGNDFTYVAADKRREPFGFVTGHCRQRMLFIDMLAMDGRYQGRGLGTALMTSAETHGRGQGCREAYLFVDEVNGRAQHFYSAKGYSFDDYVPSVRCYRMSKRLM